MNFKRVLLTVIIALFVATAYAQELGDFSSIIDDFDLTTLKPEDKALYEEALKIESGEIEGYILGAEETLNWDGESVWLENEDRLQVLQWLDAVRYAADRLQNHNAMSIYRVSDLAYRQFCAKNGLPAPEADYAMIYMVTMYCLIPISDKENIRCDQFTLNFISAAEATSNIFCTLRFYATMQWSNFDKQQMDRENQAWYELVLAFQHFYVNCVLEGSIGPMLLFNDISNLASIRAEVITTADDIQGGFIDESYLTTFDTAISDDDFLNQFKQLAEYNPNDYNPGYADDEETRQQSFKEFADAWNKWVAIREEICDTSLANKPIDRKVFENGANIIRHTLLEYLFPSDEYIEEEEEVVG